MACYRWLRMGQVLWHLITVGPDQHAFDDAFAPEDALNGGRTCNAWHTRCVNEGQRKAVALKDLQAPWFRVNRPDTRHDIESCAQRIVWDAIMLGGPVCPKNHSQILGY